jgi:hypothetical protein
VVTDTDHGMMESGLTQTAAWREAQKRPWQEEPPRAKKVELTPSKAGSEAGGTDSHASWHHVEAPELGSEIDFKTDISEIATEVSVTWDEAVVAASETEKRPRSLSDGEKAEAGVTRKSGSGTCRSPEAHLGCKVSRQKLNALQISGPLEKPEARTDDRSASRERARRSREADRTPTSSSSARSRRGPTSPVAGRTTAEASGRQQDRSSSVSRSPARPGKGSKGSSKGKGSRLPFFMLGSEGLLDRIRLR